MSYTFAVGDIHGRYDLLENAIKTIEDRYDNGKVVFLGDYVDRGPDSSLVLDCLMTGPQKSGWQWVCLKGNHEDFLLQSCLYHASPNVWLANGGVQTLASFGGQIPEHYLKWVESLPLYHKDAYRVYVHADIDEGKSMHEQNEVRLLWSRREKREDINYPDGYVVHGHTPYEDGPIVLTGRCNLDSGAVWTGKLSIAVFADDKPGIPERVIRITT